MAAKKNKANAAEMARSNVDKHPGMRRVLVLVNGRKRVFKWMKAE